MVTINRLFTMLLTCVLSGNVDNINELCILPSMVKIPYVTVLQDKNLPTFEEALSFTFPFENTMKTNYEILLKNGKILQAGIELYFYQDKTNHFIEKFYELYALANKEFGEADFTHIYSNPEYQISDLRTYNFKYNDKLFYILTGKANGLPFLIFRVGNLDFYN